MQGVRECTGEYLQILAFCDIFVAQYKIFQLWEVKERALEYIGRE